MGLLNDVIVHGCLLKYFICWVQTWPSPEKIDFVYNYKAHLLFLSQTQSP